VTRLFDMSIRYKLPLWGSLLIIATAFAVSASVMVQAYDELEEDLSINSQTLARALRADLFPALLHDDVWRAFSVISGAIRRDEGDDADSGQVHAESVLVVDSALRVFAAADPRRAPVLTELRRLGPEFSQLAEHIAGMRGDQAAEVNLPASKHYYFVAPIADASARLGFLIMVYPKGAVLPRFVAAAAHGLLVGSIMLAILIPVSWYWGQRMTRPLVQLTDRMAEFREKKLPGDLDPGLYAHRDELGRLFAAYNAMVAELKVKDALVSQMVQAERLAALGQLAAGIAHEINNPLSGMLTAIDTLKCHGDVNPRTHKTIALIERGLGQIKDTVGALLVEARVKSRDFTAQDVEDVLTLVAPVARGKALHFSWLNHLEQDVPLPATLVRQILINLLLNAVQAAAREGVVNFELGSNEEQLRLAVANDGQPLTDDQIKHLFEPFSPVSETGHGLGLWVTYQIVHQLKGKIAVERDPGGMMRFSVVLPWGASA
jgi:two-component system NtrC family sensor kinase